MSEVTGTERPPLGIRLLHALGREPDWPAMTAGELVALREAVNRKRASPLARLITGFPDRGATIRWQEVALPGRGLRVRVYRPSAGSGGGDAGRTGLPLVLHVHGGGFVGTAVQSDWVNSHLSARLPAVVVSVEHRLLDPETPLSAAVDDGWDVLQHVVAHAAQWGIDPARTAVFGESTGSMVAALAAIRARESGPLLRAQVLVNPAVDLTPAGFDHASMRRYANSPTLTMPQMRLFQRLAVPPGTDPRTVSPLHADDLGGLAPALVVVPTVDPVADHGRCYAERLRTAGTPARLTEYPGATHAFLSMPGVVPQAKAARAEIAEFLREALAT
ncbi:acetyl esterase [Streptosporangium becharense]|uniref:Acetyl esterase n=1 Tax=Streptosporangium becharense TaxID=1816182 RepID=A0A7W9IAV9_9ACTN|nr:alpha/beta hydrolase [Streptosporangium becharense]MBB2914133.1 acetyl esterase [Streptosporangium becharense]MBB5817160.1 acetyl esterase [Streptosporangium becharense]